MDEVSVILYLITCSHAFAGKCGTALSQEVKPGALPAGAGQAATSRAADARSHLSCGSHHSEVAFESPPNLWVPAGVC